jgi:biopolymer transport protein ExbB/TolQ
MGNINIFHPAVPFIAGVIFSGAVFGGVQMLPHDTFLYLFFYRCWYLQMLTTWLFGTAVAFTILRYYLLKEEIRILNDKVTIEKLEIVDQDTAQKILDRIPPKYRETLSFRRISELLRGYLYGEEVIRLNQELSERDVNQIERGHVILYTLKNLIPVLGFLGTIIGLSMGMAQFPEMAKTVSNIESLRGVLKDFAGSLSVAFDTTLLALSYSIVVIFLSSLLRHREDSFIAEVDLKARQLITKLVPMAGTPGAQGDGHFLKELLAQIRLTNDNFLKKFEELSLSLRQLPSYEIRVQPVLPEKGL